MNKYDFFFGYSLKVQAALLVSYGGVKINSNLKVIKETLLVHLYNALFIWCIH